MSVDTVKAVWKDHEADTGGGVIDFVMRHMSCDKAGALEWMESKGYLAPRQTAEPTRYIYRDAKGEALYAKARVDKPDRKYEYQHLDGERWRSGRGGIGTVPYRLPELLAASADATLYMAEGEKHADKLASWGLLATSLKDWKADFAQHVTDRTVVMLPDNDSDGRKQAEKAAAHVRKAGGRPVFVELPDLPRKGDIIDWQGTADDLHELTRRAVSGEADTLPLPTIDLTELPTRRAEPQRFTVQRIAPSGEVTLFTGPGSAGKSLFGQQLATARAGAIAKCLILDVQPGPALYLTCDDKPGQLEWRQEHICLALGTPLTTLADKLHLVSLRGGLDNHLATFAQDGSIELAPAYHRLANMIRVTKTHLVFLDNVAHLFTGNENDRGEVTRFINVLNKLASETGAAIILIAHPNKGGDSWSGSTAWLNAVRSHFHLDFMRDSHGNIVDPDARELTINKANYARNGDAILFRWHDLAFVLEDDLPTDTVREIKDIARANSDKEAFLRCLRLRNSQERPVSESPSSRTYAPRIFEKMAEAKGLRKDRFEAAMERLFRLEIIERGVVCRVDRKDREGLRERCADVRADPALTPRADVRISGAPSAQSHTPYTTYNPGAASEATAQDDDRTEF